MKRKPISKKNSEKKVFGKKKTIETIAKRGHWKITKGQLISRGNTTSVNKGLFKLFAEKIPCEFLKDIKEKIVKEFGKYNKIEGVYVVHDSMTYPRYIGRGDIFGRIGSRLKTHPEELKYFSFYVVESKKHEREIESLLVHITGTLLQFNEKKKRLGTKAGNVQDFERGTFFLERQYKRGKRKKVVKPN